MIILVTGGASSGKSEIAENICLKLEQRHLYYIATMQPLGKESLERIHKHKYLRKDKSFKTIEECFNLSKIQITPNSTVLVECLGNLLANIMFSNKDIELIELGIHEISKKAKNIVFVTNEVFSDGEDYSKETMKYIDHLAEINRSIAALSDMYIESVCGIPYFYKGSFHL